jgi:hypothetical protein
MTSGLLSVNTSLSVLIPEKPSEALPHPMSNPWRRDSDVLGAGTATVGQDDDSDFAPSSWNLPNETDQFRYVLLWQVNLPAESEKLRLSTQTSSRPTYKELCDRLFPFRKREEKESRDLQESQWLAIHRKEFAGQWIALQGDRFLGHADDAATIFRLVRGIQPKPLVMQIESNKFPFGGW